jgi:cytidylate kinase
VSVITVFRRAGCGGRYIAESLAQSLGYHLSDYQTAGRVLREYGLVQFPEIYGSAPDFWDHFTRRGSERDEINSMLRLVTLATARHGNVVMLGRGCFAPLQSLSDVLNVHLKAPLPVRIKRVMNEHQMTSDEAAEFIEEKDALVDDFARTSYGLSPDDATLFDLVIDTGKVQPESAVRWLVEAAGALKSGSDDGATTAAIPVDSVLAGIVSRELGCSDNHG